MPNPAPVNDAPQDDQATPATSKFKSKLKSSFRPSTQTQLDVAEEVLNEVEQKKTQTKIPGAVAQAIPGVVDQATDTLNPQQAPATTTFKESTQTAAVEQPSVDAGGGVQVVEHEIAPEIPVEVESFVEHVESHDQLPQEIAIAGDQVSTTPIQKVAKQPVVVLPITPEMEKKGARKGIKHSFRWLVEWSRKLMKMFVGRVVYKEVEVKT